MPQVWDEDGSQIIPSFLELGWETFLKPVNGYLITVPKLISALSLKISIYEYPLSSTIITGLFTAAVGMAVFLSPTSLRGRIFCALSMFCIPSNPECFGLPLYTFWWSSILLFLVCLWKEASPKLGWRLVFLLLGGLSSPVIVIVAPILWLRTFWKDSKRSELFVASTGTLIAVLQLYFILKNSSGKSTSLGLILNNVVPRFFGNFLVGNLLEPNNLTLWIVGLAIMAFFACWIFCTRKNIYNWILIYLLFSSIVILVARADPSGIHPLNAGPRYFFFPYILMFWILAQAFYDFHASWPHYLSVAFISIAFLNAVPAWTRLHGDLQWKEHLVSATLFRSYSIPIQYDGNIESAWTAANGYGLTISGKSSSRLLTKDWFVNNKAVANTPTFPYVVRPYEFFIANKRQNHIPQRPNFPITTMKLNHNKLAEDRSYLVFDSLKKGKLGLGVISLKLKRGGLLLYRSGSKTNRQKLIIEGYEEKFIQQLPIAKDWQTLEFSNKNLPKKFVIRIEDNDPSEGEWSEVGFQ